MITIPPGVRVLLAARPVDFRKGPHGLAALAAEVLGEAPFICVGRNYVAALRRSG